jgi:hypothetical protein
MHESTPETLLLNGNPLSGSILTALMNQRSIHPIHHREMFYLVFNYIHFALAFQAVNRYR